MHFSRKLFREFAETEFTKELQDELDETGEFNWDMHKKMARYGFMGVKIPEEYGGAGADSLTYVLMDEEFARQDAVLAIYANTSNSLGGGPLLLAGSESQKKEYLPRVQAVRKFSCPDSLNLAQVQMQVELLQQQFRMVMTLSSMVVSASYLVHLWLTGLSSMQRQIYLKRVLAESRCSS